MDYILMNKKIPVLKVDMDDGYIISVKEIYNVKYLPVEVSDKQALIKPSLRNWWSSRSIPASRDKIGSCLFNLGINSDKVPAFLLEKCFGLSLSDQYWINPADSLLNWDDINFFENDFSEDIGKALFDNQTVDNPNLMSPDNTSDGWLKKKWKIIDGDCCLIKAGARPYFQQPFNEVVASAVCRRLGIEGFVDYKLEFENGEPVSVCKNFITTNTEIVSAYAIAANKKQPNNTSNYDFYVNLCLENGVKNIQGSLDEMLVLDYIIRNEDRHTRNFGLIRNVETLEYIGAAPIFDSGTSLLYDTDTESIVSKCTDKKSPSRPFKSTHDNQIELVKQPQRFDLSKLKGIDEEAYEILRKGDFISENRANALRKAIIARVSKLERIFASRTKKMIIPSGYDGEERVSAIAQIEEIKAEQAMREAGKNLKDINKSSDIDIDE